MAVTAIKLTILSVTLCSSVVSGIFLPSLSIQTLVHFTPLRTGQRERQGAPPTVKSKRCVEASDKARQQCCWAYSKVQGCVGSSGNLSRVWCPLPCRRGKNRFLDGAEDGSFGN